MIRIIIDSTCDLPNILIKKYDISIIPLKVLLEDKEYLDKKDIQIDEVYQAMRQGLIPKTSQPNPQDIHDTFLENCLKGHDFLFLSISSLLSGTYQLAKSILQKIKTKYPELNMEVIDSKSGSVATGLIALYTAELSKEFNQSFEQLVNKVNQLVNHVEHVFCIADLSWLIKGGRISKVEGVIGNILDIKPILHVNDGALEVIKKVRGRKKSLNTILNILEERTRNMKGQIIGVSHADDIETANMLIEMIKKRLGSKDFIVTAIGSVLGSHLGIGGVGVFFFNEGAKDIIGEIKLS